MTSKDHMSYLEQVVHRDLTTLHRKEATYGGSWKKRGGAGAYMVAFRKVDRLENITTKYGYDIFRALEADMSGADGSALAELRDLRCYLILIEAEMLARAEERATLPGPLPEQFQPGTPEDGGHHSRYDEPQLDDGMCNEQIENKHVAYYKLTKCGSYIVDRDNTPEELWKHLPRLPRSLTHSEYKHMDAFYQDLYEYGYDTWALIPQYRKNWGR